MSIMKKNKKSTKDPIERSDPKNENKRERRFKWGLRIIHIALCIFIAVTVCLCGVLFGYIRLRVETQKIMRGSGSETDKIRIYIDQGHNPAPYHNSGAEGNGLYEQDLTFHIGRLLAETLTEDGRFAVCLSRPDPDTVLGVDNASSLQARVDGAADFQADYLISLHINAYTQDAANGVEALVPLESRESYDFGSALLKGLLNATELRNRGVKENSNLYVLNNATMPVALLEMGFISNSGDAALLADRPELFAEGIYDGILDYFNSLYAYEINILLGMISLAAGLNGALIIVEFILIKRKQYKVNMSRES